MKLIKYKIYDSDVKLQHLSFHDIEYYFDQGYEESTKHDTIISKAYWVDNARVSLIIQRNKKYYNI
jgi:hypothetical protein